MDKKQKAERLSDLLRARVLAESGDARGARELVKKHGVDYAAIEIVPPPPRMSNVDPTLPCQREHQSSSPR